MGTLKPDIKPTNNSNKALCAVAVDCSDNDAILNITYSTINNTTTCSPGGYGDYRMMTANVVAGQPTPVSVTVGDGWSSESVGAWVDYNEDEVFTEDEFIYIGVGSGSTINSSITIPANTPAGVYVIRFMVYAGQAYADLGCYNDLEDYGEFEDYSLNVTAAPDCNTLPSSIVLTASSDSVCIGESVNLSTDYLPAEAGFSYQLQSSVDGILWNDTLAPFYGNIISVVADSTIEYRVVLTCSVSGLSEVSNTVSIVTKTPLECLCTPILDCTDGDVITNVSIPDIGFTNASTCGVDGYTDFTSLLIPNILVGSSYVIDVTVGDGFESESVSIWIDYNDNKIFEEDEFSYIGTGSGNVVSGTLSIPSTASLGSRLMRVRVVAVESSMATSELACDELDVYGETEDYLINLVEDDLTGMDKIGLENITIFPNPTSNSIIISSVPLESTIQVLDLTGRTIIATTAKTNVETKIDVSELRSGTYHVVISNANSSLVRRIIRM